MPILTGTEQSIQQAKTVDELKVVLIQMSKVINQLYDARKDEFGDGVIIRRSGDGVWVRLGITGTGSSTVGFTELGKTLPQR
jgi:hypothetical protein